MSLRINNSSFSLSEAKEFFNKNEPMVMKIDRGVDAFF